MALVIGKPFLPNPIWLTAHYVSKVLLEQSHVHSFLHCLQLLSYDNSKLAVVTEALWPTKPKLFTV